MKSICLLTCLSITLGTSMAFGADVQDVLAHLEKYNGQPVDLVGIARVPGYFYLFADLQAATQTDLSRALLVRQNSFAGTSYRQLDRQWVRITGVVSSEPQTGWDPGSGVLLSRAEIVRDRRPPRIKDATVLGVFQNTTSESVAINLVPRSEKEGGAKFFLGPYDTDKTIIWEGRAVVSQLDGPDNLPLDQRKAVKLVARCEIAFRHLPSDYQYSPESSNRRTLYFRVFSNRIELVPASEAKDWKIVEGKTGGN